MSTDHQKYSIDNQQSVIAEYADRRGLTIVWTYKDAGRSGLRIIGRDDLQGLIDDVQSGRANFKTILVYDVSRWGRFQDVDESAYYEFICKRAGVQVHYCTDEFENDGSLASTVLKNMKRVMAGDFSRQLSRRIFIAQCHMTELGVWRGGSAGYGLRRLLVDPDGRPIIQLERGQRKSISTERVVLKLGPADEITTVKRIFRSFVSRGKSYAEIADALNNDKIPNGLGRPWSTQTIIHVLSNEVYIGNVVFNRTSFKLRQKAVINPPNMWIRRANAHEAIIAPEIFQKAQKIIARRREGRSDQELLDQLTALWKRKGHLSSRIMEADEKTPHTNTYVNRFGSLRAAYARIGFEPKRRFKWVGIEAEMTVIIDAAVAEIVRRIADLGGTASFAPRSRLLSIGHGFTITIGSARCICEGVRRRRWHVRVNRRATTDITLIFRMDAGTKSILDYYLIATADLSASRVDRLRTTSRAFRKTTRHDDLGTFYRICAERLIA
jgi:DNA invertase Pin-like site-specific DNA recombinase